MADSTVYAMASHCGTLYYSVRDDWHVRCYTGGRSPFYIGATMTWTKPEFEIVEVTMEVTAYVARR